MSKAVTREQLESAARREQGYTADVAAAAAGAIQELDSAKADKAAMIEATIAADGWVEEETAEDAGDGTEDGASLSYPFYYDIAAPVTASDRADAAIRPDSLYTAGECGFCPTTETLEGKIRVRAQLAPDGDIGVQCWITKGVDQ